MQFDKITIPYVESGDNVYKKISLQIDEFSSMSTLINPNRRYHILFDSEVVGDRIVMTPPDNDEGRFRFHTPIKTIDTLTLKLRSPFSPLNFLPDRYNVQISRYAFAPETVITTSVPHQIKDGELIYITDFISTDDIVYSTDWMIKEEIEREEGHTITYINDFDFRINVSLINSTVPLYKGGCFVASRRLLIPIRMEYLINK